MTLKVQVKREHIDKGTCNDGYECAVALAVREIFPNAAVSYGSFEPFGCVVQSTHNAFSFIKLFDDTMKDDRHLIPETEIEIYLTDEVIDHLNKTDWQKAVDQSEVLSLV